MGYMVDYEFDGVVIPAKKVKACLKAINDLYENGQPKSKDASGEHWESGRTVSRWFGFTTNPPKAGYPSLVKALDCWRLDAEILPNQDVVVKSFYGEKLSDENIMFAIIARFAVPKKLAIKGRGEDGFKWAFDFVNGELVEKKGIVSYR